MMSMNELCGVLSMLNRGKKFSWSDDDNCIHTDCNFGRIICPEGFYVRDPDGPVATLTNKHNTPSGMYEMYTLWNEKLA